MLFVLKAISNLLAAALLGLVSMSVAAHAERPASPVEAEFRGCESAGWCRFWIEAPDPQAPSLIRVRPDGVARTHRGDPAARALRDRLNALLANMIHQAKRIVLHDLRRLDDEMFAAVVTVNGADLAADPVVVDLGMRAGASNR